MKVFAGSWAVAIAASLIAGCMSIQSFVDPAYGKARYEDLVRRSEPARLKLVVEFQKNGEPFPQGDSTLRDQAERVLRASGVIIPTSDSPAGEIKIVMNNIADTGAAAAKGVGVGLTFGLVGTTVTDAYEMEVTIALGGKVITKRGIKHALHTAVGNTTIPERLEPLPPMTAFGRVVEQMLLNALKDLQQSGELSALRPATRGMLRPLLQG